MIRRPRSPWVWGPVFFVLSAWLALVEVFWLPLRIGLVPVPLSVLAAVVGNLLLITGAHRLSGSRTVAVVPAVVWLAVAVGASIRRPEGDLVLIGGGVAGGVNLAFLLLGVLAAAVAVGRVLTPARRITSRDEARTPAGSGSGDVR
jgi:hypothetical protein